MNFCSILKQLRIAKGIYQKEVAACLKVSIGTISNYEAGIHEPDLETLCRLARFYDVSTDCLLGVHKYQDLLPGVSLEEILMLPECDRLFLAQVVKRLKDGPLT